MEAYLLDWLNLLARWFHLIVGIAWIGASFYFVWLDNHLLPPTDPELQRKGVGGELWAVHGGGFYNAQKYRLAPATLPAHLHWFKWEAYSTLLSGFFLLCLIYYIGADVYLIDKNVADIGRATAIAIGLGTLAGGWILYDRLCESPLIRHEGMFAAVLALFLGAAAYGLCHIFSARGAFIHFGAMLGTIMVLNVYFVIMPGQRELVAATAAGRVPDARPGLRAKQRSVHNTYFTLPVLFAMISTHYAMLYGGRYNWAVLIALSVTGALVRIFFVARHKGNASPVPVVLALLILVGLIVALAPAAPAPVAAVTKNEFVEVQKVINARCAGCHAPNPTLAGFTAPPKGVMLDTAERIVAQATQIETQVASRTMPLGNLTNMTDQERSLVADWFAHGAKP